VKAKANKRMNHMRFAPQMVLAAARGISGWRETGRSSAKHPQHRSADIGGYNTSSA
jgi:hypothetical protein